MPGSKSKDVSRGLIQALLQTRAKVLPVVNRFLVIWAGEAKAAGSDATHLFVCLKQANPGQCKAEVDL